MHFECPRGQQFWPARRGGGGGKTKRFATAHLTPDVLGQTSFKCQFIGQVVIALDSWQAPEPH